MTKLVTILVIAAVGLFIASHHAGQLGSIFVAGQDSLAAEIIGWLLIGAVTLVAAAFVFRLIDLDQRGAAGNQGRRIIGIILGVPYFIAAFWFISATLAFAAFVLFQIISAIWFQSFSPYGDREGATYDAFISWFGSWPLAAQIVLVLAWIGLSILQGFLLAKDLKTWSGRVSTSWRAFFAGTRFGRGGSAAFAGVLDEWKNRFIDGSVLLGRSLYDPRWWVGSNDDRGFLTLASTRSGKGRSAIIPNLLTWTGSALVIDPKGTNAAVTAARRGHGGGRVTEFLGQDVYVLDPFKVVPGVVSAKFNPLSQIDLGADTVREDIDAIADALIVRGSDRDSHWDESAKAIISGLAAHLMMKGREKNRNVTLLDVRSALRKDAASLDRLFGEMAGNLEAGGLAASAAATFANAGARERGSFFTTIMRNTAWLDSVAIQKVLDAKGDFDLAQLKASPTTIYVVLPPELLDAHSRFMRLFVTLSIRAAAKGGKGPFQTLFILDEFFALGNLATIEKASGLLAGYGVRLWPIVQNLSQLHEIYPRNWETFFANASVVQAFGVNDLATADYLTRRLGKHVYTEGLQRQVSNLREADEIGRDTARESGRQIVFRFGNVPYLLRRLDYDRAFPKRWFNPDPDYDDDGPAPPPPHDPSGGLPVEEERKRLEDGPAEIEAVNHADALEKAWEARKAEKKMVATGRMPPDGQDDAKPAHQKPQPIKPKTAVATKVPEEAVAGNALAELDEMIGLAQVKKEALSVIAQIRTNKKRQAAGLPVVPVSRHMVFTGNPGTGKTTVARIIGEIYRENGLLEEGHLVEVGRGDLVGKYVGHTAPLTREKCEEALDGVLFVDEAYALAKEDAARDFGIEAIEELMAFMENNRDRIVVIAAGYGKEMERFLGSNPGLKSRFGRVIEFPDFSPDEMEEIFKRFCEENKYKLGRGAVKKVRAMMLAIHARKGKNFGNGRTARNAFQACVDAHNVRIDKIDKPSFEELTTLKPEDIPDDVSGVD